MQQGGRGAGQGELAWRGGWQGEGEGGDEHKRAKEVGEAEDGIQFSVASTRGGVEIRRGKSVDPEKRGGTREGLAQERLMTRAAEWLLGL
eukprot:754178-Hanusia_phi.AAC.10